MLMAQILSHSWYVTFLLAPWLRMNSFRASSCRPRRSMPCTVGMRGSVQSSTMPWLTNQVSLRLDSTVYTKESRA